KVGGARRRRRRIRRRVRGICAGARRAQSARGGRAGAAAQPASQRAGVAEARPAGPHVEAEISRRRRQRADRGRACAAGFTCAAKLCDQPTGQRRVRRRGLVDRSGARIGVVGVNGSGKTSVLRLLAGELAPTAGKIKRGKTLRIAHLSQGLGELRGEVRVLDAVENLRRVTTLAGGREVSAATLLEDFGFTGDKLVARVDDLSGGERRRLQFLRLLLDEPNVLLLDEPTNDLDIDTL